MSRQVVPLSAAAFVVALFIFVAQELIDDSMVQTQQLSADQHDDWGYTPEDGPNLWPLMFDGCDGRQQSPINIVTRNVVPNPKGNVSALNFRWITLNSRQITNTGHGIQVYRAAEHAMHRSRSQSEWLQVNGAFGVTDIGVLHAKADPFYTPRQFAIKHFNFHKGSENTVDGLQYALEMHIVHADEDGHLAVLCIFFKQGNEDNAWLNQLGWKTNLPPPHRVSPIPGSVDLLDALPNSLNYATYSGSLTTPPCTEGVMFFAFLQPVPISADQVSPRAPRVPEVSQRTQPPDHMRCCWPEW